MIWILTKYLVTAFVVVLVSEAAARRLASRGAGQRLGGLVAALPMVTILTLIWLHLEKQPSSKIANHAWYTLWYVLPTLPMFAAFPFLLARFGFWPTLGACVLITLCSFGLFALVLKRFGIHLL
jgi:F0F1-type ATP synthase assembly protein I